MDGNSKYIVFEGTDGSGKTTIANQIYNLLPGEKIFTKEPGSPHLDFCVKLRALILHGSDQEIDPITYAYLFAADTHEHMTKIVIPALKEGKWVVSDRSVISDFAYRPKTGDSVRIHNYHRFLSLNPKVFWIDSKPGTCEKRMLSVREEELNAFERKHVIDKLKQLRDNYDRVFREDRRVPTGDHRAWYQIPNNHDIQSAVDAVRSFLEMSFEELRSK